ncbi:hypothetical protein [Parafrankia sp. FMc2]|uniref:hypothetical protein n=1 Tax=Parafrankia sp. FMc2 TaxID=3233196 RepID=UPI0034D45332
MDTNQDTSAAGGVDDDPAAWPDDRMVDYAGFSRLTGLRTGTLRHYGTKSKGRPAERRLIPEPDDHAREPDGSAIEARPRWKVSTVRAWMASRPGTGRAGVKRGPRRSTS